MSRSSEQQERGENCRKEFNKFNSTVSSSSRVRSCECQANAVEEADPSELSVLLKKLFQVIVICFGSNQLGTHVL
jgi:hypothetical protein